MVSLWYGLLWCRIADNMIQNMTQTELKHTSKCQLTMMTSSNENIFRVTCPLCGEFTGHRWIPAHKIQWCGALIFSLLCALNKQSWGWWFETPSRSLWRHFNALYIPHLAFTDERWGPLTSKRLTHCGREDLWKWAIFYTILTSPKSWLSQDLDAGCEDSLVPMDS